MAGFHAGIRSLPEGAVERSETEGVTPPVTRNARDSPLKDGAEWSSIIPINSNLSLCNLQVIVVTYCAGVGFAFFKCFIKDFFG